ncbi:putative histidinol-phosphate transaminase, partial [Ceraceosorus guamensis]
MSPSAAPSSAGPAKEGLVPGLSNSQIAAVSSLKPAHFDLSRVIRPNILSLAPYRCARDDYQDGILLDANENSLGHSLPQGSSFPAFQASHDNAGANGATSVSVPGSGTLPKDDPLQLHRYPDPSLYDIKPTLASLRQLPDESYVMLGVGSDEVLDLLQRVAAKPGQDAILICPPTYGMYSVCAAVNDLDVIKVPLNVEGGKFSLDVDNILSTLSASPQIKLIFLCSPGNPTGTLLSLDSIRRILDYQDWNGLVVVDEAYIDFAEEELRSGRRSVDASAVSLLKEYKNLVVTQTLSKAFGLAAIRLGICYSSPALIQILNNTKAPYNISAPTAHLASLALSEAGLTQMRSTVRQLLSNRDALISSLQSIPSVGQILGANEANFVLVQILDQQGGKPDSKRAGMVYKIMAEQKGLVVRNRSSELGCEGCLRITVGTEQENERCIQLMKELL